MWTAGPKKDGIDGIARRLHAHIAKSRGHIVRPGSFADFAEYLLDKLLGLLGTRACRSIEAESELA